VQSGEWSYRRKHLNFASYALSNTGTVDIANGSALLVGTGTAFTSADIGRHVRLGGATSNAMPIEILDVAVFPNALNSTNYNVTNAAVVTLTTTFSGVQATNASFTAMGGNIRYTIDGTTTPTPSVGTQIFDGSAFTLSGHTNLDNFQVIAEGADVTLFVTMSHDTEEVTLAQTWPGATLSGASYELFQRYYALPADVDIILAINHGETTLVEKTTAELDWGDPSRQDRSDKALYFAHAGEKATTGEKLIELWPITTTAVHYSCDYFAGHTPLVDGIDRPLVPPAIIEAAVLMDCCATQFAKTGDQRWMTMRSEHRADYEAARERMMAADSSRIGQLQQILDRDLSGGGVHHDYSYMVSHDI